MAERERADQAGVGEEFEPYKFSVTTEFNQQYLEAEEDYDPRYLGDTGAGPAVVHPGLFINHSNVTRSPSFYLPHGMAAVHAEVVTVAMTVVVVTIAIVIMSIRAGF